MQTARKTKKQLIEELELIRTDLQTQIGKAENSNSAAPDLNVGNTIFSNSSEGILITDSGLNIIKINPGFTHITGYKEKDVLRSKTIYTKIHKHDSDFYKEMFLQA